MEWNLTTIGILLLVLFAGYGIGLLENYLKYSKKLKRAEQEKDAIRAEQQIKPAAPRSDTNILRLQADPTQNLNLELDGVQINSPQTVTPNQRLRLLALLSQLRPWVEEGAVATAPRPVVQPSPFSPTAGQPRPTVPQPVLAADEMPTKPLVKSIVMQINDVLQARLVGTPLESRHIRLAETPTGGVQVYVGKNRYEGIDAVPFPEVVSAIRAAIAYWEKTVK